MKSKELLMQVIDYLNGKIDIYDGKHQGALIAWDDAWSEMKYLGYNPESASDIKAYIRNELS